MQKIYIGQIGLRLEVETGALDNGIDLTGATCQLVIRRPDGQTMTVTAAVENNSLFTYTTDSADVLPVSGLYYLQSKVSKLGFDAYGNTATFNVNKLFK